MADRVGALAVLPKADHAARRAAEYDLLESADGVALRISMLCAMHQPTGKRRLAGVAVPHQLLIDNTKAISAARRRALLSPASA